MIDDFQIKRIKIANDISVENKTRITPFVIVGVLVGFTAFGISLALSKGEIRSPLSVNGENQQKRDKQELVKMPVVHSTPKVKSVKDTSSPPVPSATVIGGSQVSFDQPPDEFLIPTELFTIDKQFDFSKDSVKFTLSSLMSEYTKFLFWINANGENTKNLLEVKIHHSTLNFVSYDAQGKNCDELYAGIEGNFEDAQIEIVWNFNGNPTKQIYINGELIAENHPRYFPDKSQTLTYKGYNASIID